LILLIVAITDLVLWIVIANPEEKSFDDAVAEYIGLYPQIIADPIKLTLLNMIFLSIAIGCFIFSMAKTKSSGMRKLCYVLIVISGVFILWNLFSLM